MAVFVHGRGPLVTRDSILCRGNDAPDDATLHCRIAVARRHAAVPPPELTQVKAPPAVPA
jgi:hypothetical protein